MSRVTLVLALLLLGACTAEPVGVVRLALDAAALPDGVDRINLMLAGPGLAPRTVEVDPDTLAFEAEVTAGPARTLAVLAETDADGTWLPWYWGTTTFPIAPDEVRDVVVPAVPAAEIRPLVLLDGVPIAGAVVTTTLLDPDPDLPSSFEDASNDAGESARIVPAGRASFTATLQQGLGEWVSAAGAREIDLAQGDVVTVPLTLVSVEPAPVVARLELALGELHVGEAVDLIVRALDAEGRVVEDFAGTVVFEASDALALAVPAPYTFDPAVDRGEHVFAGGVQGLLALAGLVLHASVEGDPGVSGERVLDVLALDEIVGEAVRLVLEVLGDVHGGLLAAPVDLRVTALDEAGHVVTGYLGEVTFADSDRLLLAVPPDTVFTPEDMGVHHFVGGVQALLNLGLAVLRVRDVDDASLAGELQINIL